MNAVVLVLTGWFLGLGILLAAARCASNLSRIADLLEELSAEPDDDQGETE